MGSKSQLTEAHRQYASAYAAHYTAHDLPAALRLYAEVMASHPFEPEADYCRMQIRNIIKVVVPEQELLNAEIDLVVAHFERDRTLDAERAGVATLAAGLLAQNCRVVS